MDEKTTAGLSRAVRKAWTRVNVLAEEPGRDERRACRLPGSGRHVSHGGIVQARDAMKKPPQDLWPKD